MSWIGWWSVGRIFGGRNLWIYLWSMIFPQHSCLCHVPGVLSSLVARMVDTTLSSSINAITPFNLVNIPPSARMFPSPSLFPVSEFCAASFFPSSSFRWEESLLAIYTRWDFQIPIVFAGIWVFFFSRSDVFLFLRPPLCRSPGLSYM